MPQPNTSSKLDVEVNVELIQQRSEGIRRVVWVVVWVGDCPVAIACTRTRLAFPAYPVCLSVFWQTGPSLFLDAWRMGVKTSTHLTESRWDQVRPKQISLPLRKPEAHSLSCGIRT
jgi:hypothetical protein